MRRRVRATLEREAAGKRRHVVVLAVDGIPTPLASAAWSNARTESLRSVFPSTSSSAWLSSVSGVEVDDHGVPGVVFACPEGSRALIHVFQHRGPLPCGDLTTFFDDAASFAYKPLALLADLTDLDCSWRDAVLHGAEELPGSTYYAASARPPQPAELGARLLGDVRRAWRTGAGSPCLVWALVDVDRHVHRHGYDDHVGAVLEELARVAEALTEHAVVMAYSDHGLVPTRHDPDLARLIDDMAAQYQCLVGGAGRTRWLYPAPGTADRLHDALARRLPADVELCGADQLFRPGSRARERVGDLVLIARGDSFLVDAGYTHEHGSLTPTELDVPFATWPS